MTLSTMTQKFIQIEQAQQVAQLRQLREKAVCMVTRSIAEIELLVFDHVPDDSGVQVPAGGVEAGETPAEVASRECREETGCTGFGSPLYLGSAVWINAEHQKREMRHFFQLTAPPDLPETGITTPTSICFVFAGFRLASPN